MEASDAIRSKTEEKEGKGKKGKEERKKSFNTRWRKRTGIEETLTVGNKGVEDGHGLVGDTSVWVNLLQHLVDVGGV